ncbi:hypothetical protein XENTR_v10013104 [Xenopus tropicalis]|uniref:LOC100145466 protein n=1 Tax=Xenopus tropicalis TaxID=8364 RepID=B1H2R1_XENTR|nr:NF-kappa-B inhibitor epsilon [Xenopus tropicalis]AAI61095.1 LOC100145466 protein [Xenopus tropicalis]KAE8600152.1 hypothetical protein XENTR_v10013104 [Xenopus tropicalis]|eukprot:NP_001120390.1 NF-kappa-B inhibitor epsilon [Xenopus tropicalis]
MSDYWDEKKLPAQPEEGRYDSGVGDSVQSLSDPAVGHLQSLPEERGAEEPAPSGDKLQEPQELDRLDSLYGSSSLTELLPETSLPKSDSEGPDTPDSQQLECLTYVSEEGDTFLHLTVIHGWTDTALCFISLAPADVLSIQNDLYQTGLHLATYLGQLEVVEALVSKGVNLELQDRKGDTALHVACKNQNLACAKALLQGPNGPQNLQLQNWKGLSCLHIATLKGNSSLISLLLKHGADINDQEGTSGKTPLHLAVEMLDGALLTHLLQQRPEVDSLMYNGCTPLHLAVGRKDAGLARLLCQAGADTLRRNREGDTPQDLAEGNNQLLALLPFDDLKISGRPIVTTA